MTGPSRTVLVVAAAPDRRASSRSLLDLVAELDRRPETAVALWYLRDGEDPEPGAPAPDHVVDHLRTWRPAVVVDRVLGPANGNRLRAVRLRRWLRDLDPDVVLLDDGLGDRILGSLGPSVVRVARRNVEPPDTALLEPAAPPSADLWLVAPGADPAPADAGAVLVERPVRDLAEAARLAAPVAQARLRERAGLPPDAPVVVGWGEGFLDGTELFPRLLWALAARHGVVAHGLWVGPLVTPDEEARLRAEAERCGVGERYHLVREGPALRTCGDVAVLPYRDRADDPRQPTAELPMVAVAVAAGLPVAAFAAAVALDDPAVTSVADLDLDALAAAVAAGLAGDRSPAGRRARVEAARRRLDVRPWADDLLAAVDGVVRR